MRIKGPCLLVVIAAAAVLLGTMNADAKDGNFDGGDGTPSNPYVIEDVQDLQGMSGDLSAHYVLGNDIDASETAMWNSGAGFEPVGTRENNFTGTLDGANNIIRGFNIYRRTTHYVGLFGYIGKDGIVRDVALSYNRVHAQNRVGGLAGVNEGAILNCSAMGNLTYGLRGVGGLVGNNYGTISDCNFMGDINGRYNTGGLVGYNTGRVSSCHVGGNVSGEDDVGGLVGSNQGTVSRSHATANVTCNKDYSSNVGGLVGSTTYGATVSDCYASGNVSGAERVGGLLGSQNGKVHNSYYNIDGVLINGGNHVTMWGLFDAQYRDWFSSGLSLDISDYSGSLIPTAGSYEIRDVQGLRDLLGFSHVDKYRFYLATDIDLSSAPGLYIPYLRAEFDGDNHTISGLRIDLPFVAHVGMFGISAQGTIANIGLEDVNVTGGWYVGGLVGSNGGKVSDCYVIGKINGSRYVGGFVGSNSGPVTTCYTMATVTGVSYYVGTGGVGGLVGRNYDGPISNCYATGNVTGANYVGGLVGSNRGNVSNCYAVGQVNGSSYVGGLVGEHTLRTINNTYATGDVIGRHSYVGGLVGRVSGGTVSGCFWDRESSGLDSSHGGKGRTTVEMKTRSTFTDEGWDFNGTWCIIEGVTYPFLRWQDARPPIADAGPDHTVDEGDTVTFDGSGSSDDFSIDEYRWNLTDGTVIVLNGVRPERRFDNPGTYRVTLSVTDVVGKSDEDVMIVTVYDVTAPVADPGPDRVIDEGTLVTFNGSGSHDNVGIVNWTWSFVDSESITLWGVQPIHRFEAPGTFVVTLQVSDAEGNVAIDIVTIIVTDVNNPPVIVSDVSESLDALEDEIFTLDLSAEDIDGDVLTWSDNTDLFNIDPVTGAISFVPVQDDVDIHDITITVDDGNGGTDVLTFRMEVIEVNDPPEIASDQPSTVDVFEDQLHSFYILGTDEEDLFVTWSDDTNLFDISPTDGTISFLPTQSEVGEWWVNITATDSGGLTDVVLIGFAVQNVNDPPIINSFTPENGGSYNHGVEIILVIEVWDEDGDDLTFSWIEGDETLEWLDHLHLISPKAGEHIVKVIVSDGNDSVEHEFTFTVKNKEKEPEPSLASGPWLWIIVVIVFVVIGVGYWQWKGKDSS